MSDDRYKLRVLTRCTVAGLRLRPGNELLVPADKLRVVSHLIRCGAAKAADERTRLDAALHRLLAEVLPR